MGLRERECLGKQQEIQKMIEYEVKVETNRQMNEEKIQKQAERAQIRERILMMKRKEVVLFSIIHSNKD